MINQGPILETLTHRLAETPSEFLAEPRIGKSGAVFVPALVNDVLLMQGARAAAAALARFEESDPQLGRNRLALVMIASWLVAHEWFIRAGVPQPAMLGLLDIDLRELATGSPAHQFVRDPDRREELARIALARLGFRPQGESIEQATDRLSSISGSERRRLLEASRASNQRAKEVREALARKAAEESADKWTRE
jgi:hypothetical protein